MSTIEEKNTIRRNARLAAEAAALMEKREAVAIADMMKPEMEGKIRTWIKEEISLILHPAMLKQRSELSRIVKEMIKEEVSSYCRSVFDTQSGIPSAREMEDEYFQVDGADQ